VLLALREFLFGVPRLVRAVKEALDAMTTDLASNLFVFLLATFLGLEVIRRVTPLLHTPLMSLTNAISAIAIVASITITGEQKTPLSTILGAIAVAASMTNIVGGFMITDRMLKMFRRPRDAQRDKPGATPKPGSASSPAKETPKR
jgi:proton-translocating NAD(P)+ transhydrogenase subunit alpha